jgi:uncharacterized lipoprotein YehR (DUF1307 family)
MLTENDLVRVSSEGKILLEILKELHTLNSNIEGLREDLKPKDINVPFSDETTLTIDYTSMKRAELIKLVGELDNKPKEYVKLSNNKLIELLKEG